MGKNHYMMKKAAVLVICTALAVGGCAAPVGNQDGLTARTQSGTQMESSHEKEDNHRIQKQPAYIYYIKDANLMRADVNADIEPGTNPSVIMEEIGESSSLESYYEVQQTGDGSFLVFNFEEEGENYDYQYKIVAVDSADGEAEVVREGDGWADTLMCRGKVLIQAWESSDDTDDTPANLYSYAPGEGEQLLLSDVDSFSASEDGSVICFTRLDEEGNETLYIYRDGVESWLADDMTFAGADQSFDNIYAERYMYDEEYCELVRIGRDGKSEEILTKDDGVAVYYLDPDSGGVYCFKYGEDDSESLYYWSDGEMRLLSGHVDAVWDYTQDLECLDGMPMLTYIVEENGEQKLFAAVDGTVSEFMTPGMEVNWMNSYLSYITGEDNELYLAVTGRDSSDQASESRIYQYRFTDGKMDWSPECVARGTSLGGIKLADGAIFYTDDAQTKDLYYAGKCILKNVYTDSVLVADHDEYFAFQRTMPLAQGMLPLKWAWIPKLLCSGSEPAPNLMRITTAGSSKQYLKNVALCEAYAGGLVMLSDCSKTYPHHGTLAFYGGMDLKVVDEDVTVFFQHDEEQLADCIPWSWAWDGPDGTDDGEYFNWYR